jgi:H+/Cl- antiporter ClcA
MQGPLAATVMIIELAHHSVPLLVPMLIAVVAATVISRITGSPSIYSARLGEKVDVERRQSEAADPPPLDPETRSERPQRR